MNKIIIGVSFFMAGVCWGLGIFSCAVYGDYIMGATSLVAFSLLFYVGTEKLRELGDE